MTPILIAISTLAGVSIVGGFVFAAICVSTNPTKLNTDVPGNAKSKRMGSAETARFDLSTAADFFRLALNTEKSFLFFFKASWCAPCETQTEILKGSSLAENGINLVEVDVDRFPELVKQFQVTTIPTLMYFQNGMRFFQVSGLRSENEIEMLLNSQRNRGLPEMASRLREGKAPAEPRN